MWQKVGRRLTARSGSSHPIDYERNRLGSDVLDPRRPPVWLRWTACRTNDRSLPERIASDISEQSQFPVQSTTVIDLSAVIAA